MATSCSLYEVVCHLLRSFAACPSKCEKCKDNGDGKGICEQCYARYEINEDQDDDTKSGTKCLGK
jgi:hypothetical protein